MIVNIYICIFIYLSSYIVNMYMYDSTRTFDTCIHVERERKKKYGWPESEEEQVRKFQVRRRSNEDNQVKQIRHQYIL